MPAAPEVSVVFFFLSCGKRVPDLETRQVPVSEDDSETSVQLHSQGAGHAAGAPWSLSGCAPTFWRPIHAVFGGPSLMPGSLVQVFHCWIVLWMLNSVGSKSLTSPPDGGWVCSEMACASRLVTASLLFWKTSRFPCRPQHMSTTAVFFHATPVGDSLLFPKPQGGCEPSLGNLLYSWFWANKQIFLNAPVQWVDFSHTYFDW